MTSRGPWIDTFGDNFLWSNATLIIKGMAPYGVVALEEIDRAARTCACASTSRRPGTRNGTRSAR